MNRTQYSSTVPAELAERRADMAQPPEPTESDRYEARLRAMERILGKKGSGELIMDALAHCPWLPGEIAVNLQADLRCEHRNKDAIYQTIERAVRTYIQEGREFHNLVSVELANIEAERADAARLDE